MSRIVLLLVVVCAALCQSSVGASFTAAQYETQFTAWMQTHSKAYAAEEFAERFGKFKSNVDFCEEFNKRNATFTVAPNVFGDLSLDEFKNLLMRPSTVHARDLEGMPEFTGEGVKVARSNLDWRQSGAVTPIKDQGQCGSCWTFSAAGAIESAYQISTGSLVSLSEQNLLDCVQGSQGCNGGSYMSAFSYVSSNNGIATESAYPYTGKQGTCGYSASNRGANINGYSRVTANDEGALLAAVNKQPVSVGIEADLQSFQNYRSGTYSDSGCTAAGIDHAVIAIGYGTDSNGDYWLIKNSWGTGWGEQGFMQMQRGVNMCGIAAQAAFPTRTSTTSTSAGTTTGSAATTAKTTTGTTGSATSTTGTTRSGYVFQDALASGWSLGYYGTVSNYNTQATGQTGYGVSATIGPQSALAFVSNPALSTTPFTTFKFAVKSTGSSVTYSLGSTAQTLIGTSSTMWKSASTPLSSLGSPSSVSTVVFTNTASSAVTVTLDNIQFA